MVMPPEDASLAGAEYVSPPLEGLAAGCEDVRAGACVDCLVAVLAAAVVVRELCAATFEDAAGLEGLVCAGVGVTGSALSPIRTDADPVVWVIRTLDRLYWTWAASPRAISVSRPAMFLVNRK